MTKPLVNRLGTAAAALLLLFSPAMATADFVNPSLADSRFGWNWNDAGSVYAEWDVFTIPFGAPGNLPDVDSFGSGASSTLTNPQASHAVSFLVLREGDNRTHHHTLAQPSSV